MKNKNRAAKFKVNCYIIKKNNKGLPFFAPFAHTRIRQQAKTNQKF